MKRVGKIKESIPDISRIDRTISISIDGNHQDVSNIYTGEKMMGDLRYMSDKQFMDHYEEEIWGKGKKREDYKDDDSFEDNGMYGDVFNIIDSYVIVFNDGSEIRIEWDHDGTPIGEAEIIEEGTLASKWISEYESDGWDMDIDSLHKEVFEKVSGKKMQSGGIIYVFDEKEYSEQDLIDFADASAEYDIRDATDAFNPEQRIVTIEDAIKFLGKDEVEVKKMKDGGQVDEEIDSELYGTVDKDQWDEYNSKYKGKIKFAPYSIPDAVAVFDGKEQMSKKFHKMYGSLDHIKKAFEYIENKKKLAKVITDAGDADKYPELIEACNCEVVALTRESYQEGYRAYKIGGQVDDEFQDYYKYNGAMIFGGYYDHTEKKGLGGFILGALFGGVGGYVYRDNIQKGIDKTKKEIKDSVSKMGKGGHIGKSIIDPSKTKGKRKKAYKSGLLSTNSNMSYLTDKERKAKSAGKRVSKDGNVYYEFRPNRSDISRKKKPHL